MQINYNFNQLFTEATKAHQNNQLLQAETIYKQILKNSPNHGDALHLLGIACSQQGKHDEGAKYLRQAVAVAPNKPVFLNNLAETLRRKGDLKESIKFYKKALELAPTFTEAHYNLANVLKLTSDSEGATSHYQQAIQINPAHPSANFNLGNTYLEQGKFRSAMENYQRAIQITPNSAEANNNLGIAYREFDRLDEALEQFKKAIQLKPDFLEGHRNTAIAYEARGEISEAKKHYENIIAASPDNKMLSLHIESLCPIIPLNNAEIDLYRENLLKNLEPYTGFRFKVDLDKLNETAGQPSSMLIYQGRDDLPIKVKYAEIFKNIFPLTGKKSSNQKKHIGFVVTNGHEGVFIKCMRGILNNLPAEKFQLTIVCSLPNGEKILRPAISNPDVKYLSLPTNFSHTVETVRKAKFDILYYWEVGTDATNYFLPYFALADVQCTSWGWPVTSGIPQLNYFISAEFLETEESDSHYTEKLIRFKNLPVYYYYPPVPEVLKPRSHFDLPDNAHVYLCSQNLRKVHPDYDRLAAEILRRDRQGILLFIEDKQPNISLQLKTRLLNTYPDIKEQVRFMPRMPEEEYLNLVVKSDVILDTLYYTGGANTSYDAFACNTPVVTLPTAFHRGRYTYAAYKQMNVSDCIADSEEDYINKAVKLGADPDYRQIIKDKIKANCSVLFEDMSAVDELTNFFLEVK